MIGFREAKKAKRKSLLTTAGWNSVILSPVWRQIAEKLRKMEARVGAGWNSVVLSSYDDGRSAVGGLLPVFQSASAGNNSTADLSSSSVAGIGEEESRLIFTEPLLDGGVRFVFAVPAVEEFAVEGTVDLLGETWSPLSEDEVKILRESPGDRSDRLTMILLKAEGKQRFLRLTPLK